MAYLLYEHAWNQQTDASSQVKVFTPCPGRLFMPTETKSRKSCLARGFFWLMSAGKARIYYICDENGHVIHTSYVLPKFFKFPFMKKGDYEIGPCQTAPAFRGRGLYGAALNRIITEPEFENAHFYMIVDNNNRSSVRGIEKAGFHLVGNVIRTKFLKRYCKTNDSE